MATRQATYRLAGGISIRQPYARVDYISQSGTKKLASGDRRYRRLWRGVKRYKKIEWVGVRE